MAYQKISDRVANVRGLLGNRLDIDARIRGWLANAYLELGNAYPLEDLLSTEDVLTVIPPVAGTTDIYTYPAGVRAIRNISIIDSSGLWQPLNRRSIKMLDKFSPNTPAKPTIYASYTKRVAGAPPTISRIILVRAIPDAVYTMRWRVWLKPVLEAVVADTYLYMPDDWLEILDYSAAMRGFTELIEPDKAGAIYTILFGPRGENTLDPKTGRPKFGLIAQRMTAMEAEYVDAFYGMPPVVRPITYQR